VAFIIMGIIVTPLCLREIHHTNTFQKITCVIRFTILVLMIATCLYYIGHETTTQPDYSSLTAFKMNGFVEAYNGVIFAFIMHHSAATVLRRIKPQEQLNSIMKKSIFTGYVVLIAIAATGCVAFGNYSNDCGTPSRENEGNGYPCQLTMPYSTNFLGLSVIGPIINLYPLLNAAPFPILVITLRNNLVRLVSSCAPRDFSTVSKASVSVTGLILVPAFFLSYIGRNQLGDIVEFCAGYAGVIIMLILPALMVRNARKIKEQVFAKVKNVHESYFKEKCLVGVLFGVGVLNLVTFTGINIYKEIH